MDYPRVLILGETFRLNGGGGITMINLFKDWPSDNLAVATERLYETSPNANCDRYYQLGNLEIKIPFPLCLFIRIAESGNRQITSNPFRNAEFNNVHKRGIKSFLRLILNKFLVYSGLYHFTYRIVPSAQLLEWIRDFSPDIIYAQPFRFFDMRFILELHKKSLIPLAIHVMDDSISFLNKPNLLYLYWRKKTTTIFKQLVDNSQVHLSISKFMSDEYFRRYDKVFLPMRNPIEISQWLPFTKRNWEISGITKIVYTGRLAIPNIRSLLKFCEVVDELNRSGMIIRFDIFSIDDNIDFRKKIINFKGSYINKPVPYTEIPTLLPKYDIVLLPIDFNKTGIKYAKYSISTKTSEYMISGVPILLFAPKEVALTSYAIENNCMLSVTEDKYEKLTDALIRLINDKSLRESLAKKAFDVVRKDSDANNVRQEFKFLLSSVINI